MFRFTSTLHLLVVLAVLAIGCSRGRALPAVERKPPPPALQVSASPSADFPYPPKPGDLRVELTHEMIYQYDHAVQLGEQILRVRPLADDAVPIAGYTLSIEPEEHSVSWQHDPFGSTVARVAIPGKVSRFAVKVRLLADVSDADRALPSGSGSCRDSAWLLVQALRGAGIAARFVSGYLVELARPDVASTEDTLALHAWADLYLPDVGWIGIDATSGRPASHMHIPLAVAPSPEIAAPLEGGLMEPAQADLTFPMRVRRITPASGMRP